MTMLAGPSPQAIPGQIVLQKAYMELYEANQRTVNELSSIIEESESAVLKMALTHVRDKLLPSSENCLLYSELKKQPK